MTIITITVDIVTVTVMYMHLRYSGIVRSFIIGGRQFL